MLFSKQFLSLFFILLFSLSTSLAQESPVIIEPEKPEPGEMVTITYHPDHPDATIKSPEKVTFVRSFGPTLFNQPKEMPLEQTDNGWEISFKLLDTFNYATFYFKSGDQVDKNINNRQYELMGYRDGNPAEGAYVTKTHTLSNRYKDLSDSTLSKKRINCYNKELENHPSNFDAKIRLIAHKLNQETENKEKKRLRQKAYEVIDGRIADNPGSYTTLQDAQIGYKLIDEKAKGDSLEEKIIEKYPESDVAMLRLYEQAKQEKHVKKKIELYERFLNTNFEPTTFNKYNIQSAYKTLVKYYANLEEYEKAKKTATQWLEEEEPIFEHQIQSNNYLDVAQLFLEHQDLLDSAMEYAQQALDLTDKDPAATIKTSMGLLPKHFSNAEVQKVKNQRKGDILGTIGQIYIKKNEYDKAEQYITKAKELSDSRTIKKYLANYYLHTEKPSAAYDIYWDILMEIPTNDFYQKKLKEAYIAENGFEKGFEEETKELNEAWEKKMVKKLNKERIDKKAPDFDQITDLKGNPINIDKFENKVLVIDFWATWCKPCLQMFPHVQNVYEKYEDHPDVEFVILHSAWGEEIEEAKEWSQKNDYTFPLYFDSNSTTTEAFEVRALPTTYFVDTDGKIQFHKMGLRGNNIERKIELRIEMLLDESNRANSTKSR